MKTCIANFTLRSQRALHTLFDQAKSIDEFEYVCALIRFPGVAEAKKGLDLLHVGESRKLIEEITQFFLNRELELHTKTRLGLLLYGHIIEMRDLYITLGNLLDICRGKAYQYALYRKRKINIDNHVKSMEAAARKIGMHQIPELFEEFYSKGIRDTFFHANYLLKNDRYHLLAGQTAKYQGKQFVEFDLERELIPILQKAINFGLAYFQIREDKLRSYDKERILVPTHPTTIRGLKLIPTSEGVHVTLLNVPE